eukprot:489589-Amphidinium_carterae.2
MKMKAQVSASLKSGFVGPPHWRPGCGAFVLCRVCETAWSCCHQESGRCTLPPPEFGKNALAFQACVESFGSTLRELGRRGTAIEHLVCDWAYLQALDRMGRQRMG